MADSLADSSDSPEKRMLRSFDRSQIDGALETLKPQEAKVLRLRFGLDEKGDHTLEEIGRMLGVTRERIRQIEVKAIEKLRHLSRAGSLGLPTRTSAARRIPEDETDAAR
jgi:RNA polymerase primary sigma factor